MTHLNRTSLTFQSLRRLFHVASSLGWRIALVVALAAALAVSLFAVNPGPDEAWQRVRRSGVITFATDPTFPPFESLDANGNFWGFDIDLARALAQRLGVKAEFEAVAYDGLIGALVAGRSDAVISALVIQPERGEEASFTPPYFNAGVVLVTRRGRSVTPAEIQNWAAHKTLAAEYGTEGDALIRQWSRIVAGLTPISSAEAAAAARAVEEGQADGALMDAVTAFELLPQHSQLQLAAYVPEAGAPYAIAVSAESPVLRRELARALQQMEDDGSLGELRVKWLGEAAR